MESTNLCQLVLISFWTLRLQDLPHSALEPQPVLVLQQQSQELSPVPLLNMLSSPPDEALVLEITSPVLDDCKTYQKPLRRMAAFWGIQVSKLVEENTQKLTEVLHPTAAE